MLQNGGDRKYVPVNPKELANLVQNESIQDIEISCLKAYADVHALSINDELAFVCCTKQGPFSTTRISPSVEQYQSDLCNSRIPYFNIPIEQLPFSKRLARFPEAWFLPLLPILIRLMYQLILSARTLVFKKLTIKKISYQSLRSGAFISSSSSSASELEKGTVASTVVSSAATPNVNTHASSNDRIKITIQRLLFYFLILNFRGWGLYIGANAIEDYVIVPWFTGDRVLSRIRTDSVSDVEHNIQSSNNDCWYKDALKAHHRSEMEREYYSDCYGRPFDFSDHIVLYLAHYLPIFVLEMIICWNFPFWVAERATSKIYFALHFSLFLYMHLLLLHAVYQTTKFFHTSTEVIVGYLISLLIQCPLMYLLISEKWVILRQFIGLPSSQIQKGD